MNNKIVIFIACALLSSSMAFSKDDKLNEAKNSLINSQVEYTKATIDYKCQKIKEKIKRCEDQLQHWEKSNEISLIERSKKTRNKIKKYEDKIDALRLMKLSLDTINFNSL